MRKTQLTSAEIEEAEKAKEERKGGFRLMAVRDRGFAELSDGTRVRWHTDRPWIDQFMYGDTMVEIRDNTVPEGKFMINDQVYDAEELRKFLRWA